MSGQPLSAKPCQRPRGRLSVPAVSHVRLPAGPGRRPHNAPVSGRWVASQLSALHIQPRPPGSTPFLEVSSDQVRQTWWGGASPTRLRAGGRGHRVLDALAQPWRHTSNRVAKRTRLLQGGKETHVGDSATLGLTDALGPLHHCHHHY